MKLYTKRQQNSYSSNYNIIQLYVVSNRLVYTSYIISYNNYMINKFIFINQIN